MFVFGKVINSGNSDGGKILPGNIRDQSPQGHLRCPGQGLESGKRNKIIQGICSLAADLKHGKNRVPVTLLNC